MKRISKIEIENARAYYDRLAISLNKGENLLLYGEDGSGKTSLYKSLNDFIQSFYTQVGYMANRYKPAGVAGEVKLGIGDYDPNTLQFSNEVDYSFGKGVDNTHVQNTGFMKALAQTKGFLNYRDLLKVYLYDEADPNLFEFFVLHLLKNHVPIVQGQNVSIEREWKELNDDIFRVYNSNANKHHRGKNRLTVFENVLRSVLTNLFSEVNKYLTNYFSDFNLTVDYVLKPMTFHYNRGKREWKIDRDLRLTVDSGHSQVADYTEGLNEARLSAIAICFYLAALRANPGSDLRVMFLDDIFIGIDAANRLPILKILNQEFKDFQILIATYDRSWYCLARKFLMAHNPGKWKCVNLYVLPTTVDGITFMKPVLIEGKTNFDQARKHLHGGRDMDLPAAANYFRKTIEELLDKFPSCLYLNDDFTVLPGFKVSQRAEAIGKLFAMIGEDTQHIFFLLSYLHPLIHPLSHYEEEAPVYRSELIEVERAINGFRTQVEIFPKKCGLLIGKGNKLAVHYDTPDGVYKSIYQISFEENVWLYKDTAGNPKLTDGKCRTYYMEGWLNGVYLGAHHLKPNIPKFSYMSLDDGLTKIYYHEINDMNHHVVAHNAYDIVERIIRKGLNEPLQVKIQQLLARM